MGGGVSPYLREDFSTYTSTANMIADPRNIYSNSEEFNTNYIVLDTGVGYGALTQSMRYDWPATGSAPGITISRQLDFPSNQTEVWIEFAVRFSSNFSIDANYAGGKAYKLFHANIASGGPAGRFGMQFENGDAGTLNGEGPNDDYQNLYFTTSTSSSSLWDQSWHVIRWHISLGATDTHQIWVDGVSQGSATGSTAATGINGLAIGKNMNQGPLQTQEIWWGYVDVYTQNPGW